MRLEGHHRPSIAELGHVGLRCRDVQAQLRFFTEMLGLIVTDHDEELGVWFLSARPESEHHELLLTSGRADRKGDPSPIQQISFRCPDLADVRAFHHRLLDAGVELDMVVSHGNAVGVYFFDPEGNRCELYWQTGFTAKQPFVQHVDLDADEEALVAEIRRSAEQFGATGFTDADYVDRVRGAGRSESPTGAQR